MWCAALAAATMLVGAGAGVVEAQSDRLDDCCLLLLVPVGARSSGLGGAVTSSTGPESVFRNPAGLAGLGGSTFMIHHSDRAVVDINAFSLLLTPSPGTLGLSYQLFDKGATTTTDPSGQPTGELTFRDHLGVASFGARIGRGMAVGASYKLFQERIDCRGACGGAEQVTTFHAVDLGYRYAPLWHPPLELGLALVNMPLRRRTESGPGTFPSRIHAGMAYDVLHALEATDMVALRVALELQDELRHPGSPTPSAGVELDFQQVVFVRTGYTMGEGLASGAAIGVELRFDRFDLGVARSFANSSFDDDEAFQISFGVHF